MKPTLYLLLILPSLFILSCQNNMPEEQNNAEIDIDSLMAKMTFKEKVDMIHASSSFTSGGVERLGIPELIMSDGPHGVRHEHGRDWEKDESVYDSSTYLPVGTALAATWNKKLGYEFGSVLGSEANFRGKDVILGPGFNIIRSPLNGRNFEYLTEDPYLNARMVVGYIKGVQDQGVAACAKHYIANTLEYEREYVNVEMSDRAFREIYLPAFAAAVQEADVYTIMAAYNKFRGTYCAHSQYLLDMILRDDLGFDGVVISDWAAVKETKGALHASLDIEMGTDLKMLQGVIDYGKFHLGDTLIKLEKQGLLDVSLVDRKVRRILELMVKINKFGERQPGEYNTPEHQQVARKVAEEAITLLKNDGVLPLDPSQLKSVAVIGANANRKHAGAGGSSQVKAFYEVTGLEGIKNHLEGEGVEVDFAPGYEIARERQADPEMIQEAVELASSADAAIYIGGWIHGYTDEWGDNAYDAEVVDKPSMQLPFGQDELIRELLKANPNTIIVLMGGGPVDMRAWVADAKGIVQAWYPGMDGGNVLADILFGKVNPSGKLPMTFPKKLEDSPAHSLASYPDENLLIDHKEGIFVGYRYFDTYKVEPEFAFGHGLSYTSFEYKELKVEKKGNKVKVKIAIENTGDRAGAEVVQLYVHDMEASVKRPEKELKAFEKVFLEPGAVKTIELELDERAFSFYDEQKQSWVTEPGQFNLLIGSSSRDIRLEGKVVW